MNQAIVLVSFGVLDMKQREKCIEPIAAEIRDAFYDYMVFEAYTSDIILKTPNGDIMNALAKSILTLSSYDTNTMDLSIPNIKLSVNCFLLFIKH